MSSRDEALALMKARDDMEKELNEIIVDLENQGVGMTRTLVTFDGYPRDDIDIPKIRGQRQRAIMLQNDLKRVMEEIRLALNTAFKDQPAQDEEPESLEPFCYVGAIDLHSPAEDAGLQTGDRIVKFGSITAKNSSALRALPGELSKNQIRVLVQREELETLYLEPATGWGGPGKLGCRVLPL